MMQHISAWHVPCSIPLLDEKIWLPSTAVFNFASMEQWLRIISIYSFSDLAVSSKLIGSHDR